MPLDLGKTSQALKETNRQVITQTLGFISSAFVLIAALAWNEAIKELISGYLPTGAGLASKLIYAIIVTILAVIVTMRLTKLGERFKEEGKTSTNHE